ncbi:hypothetical protein JXVLWARM_CDS_0078 [Burkholderia phage Bm1]
MYRWGVDSPTPTVRRCGVESHTDRLACLLALC